MFPRWARVVSCILYCLMVPVVIAIIYWGNLHRWTRDQLAEQQSVWESLKPVQEAVQIQQSRLNLGKQFLQELDGWNRNRIICYPVMTSLDELIPNGVHLAALQIFGSLECFSAPQADKKHPAPQVGREYQFRFCFKGDQTVGSGKILNFLQSMRQSHEISKYFSSITIGGIDKDSPMNIEDTVQIFCVDAVAEKRYVIKP